jgi:catecholate siderophore receptor
VVGVIVQLGGQTPLGLARRLAAAGVPIVGTSPESIHLAEDRGAFGDLLDEAGLRSPAHGTATSFAVPFAAPTVGTPIDFRQSASDADNATTASVAGVYLQDQVSLSRYLQAIVGVRYDRFAVRFENDRNSETLRRDDGLLSPRAGLVLKPAEPLSFYASYSVSYLPSSGDQFGSLNATTKALEPERFDNYEAGAKWDLVPGLAVLALARRRAVQRA